MKKISWFMSGIVVLLVFLFVAPLAPAAEKTGFVNIGEVLAKSDAGKKAEAQFKKLVEKDRETIQDREGELKKLKEEFEKQRPLLKEEVLKAKEADYQKKFRDYQLMVKDANEELQAKQQDILKSLVPEIMKVVNTIGDREKYTMIVDLSTIPMAYHAKENDITQRVIEEFNKAPVSKAQASKAPAGKSSAGKSSAKKK
jgi:outer membrane protein